MMTSRLMAVAFFIASSFLPVSSANADSPPTAARNGTAAAQPGAAAIKTASIRVQDAPAPFGQAIAPSAVSSDLTLEEQQLLDLVNSERTSRGFSKLGLDPILTTVAREHSREMCDLHYFDHHSPTAGLVTPMNRYTAGLRHANAAIPPYLLVGENIFYCSKSDGDYNVGFGHQQLMKSPGHRANILEPRFTKVGIGICRNSKGEFWITQVFLRDTD